MFELKLFKSVLTVTETLIWTITSSISRHLLKKGYFAGHKVHLVVAEWLFSTEVVYYLALSVQVQ